MPKPFKKGLVLVPDDFKGVCWIEKMKSAGLNTLGMHSGGGPAHDVFENLKSYGSREFQAEVAAAGLELEYELHASKNLLPECYFDTHPEYFMQTLRPKKRRKNHTWCVTNPEAQKIVADSAAEIIRRLPSSTHHYFLWGCDGGMQLCHCHDCAAYTASEQALIASNLIARSARTVDAKAKVCYLAYYETLSAPRLVMPESNVICEFAPYFRSHEYAICDSRSSLNRRHIKCLFDLLEIFGAERMHILEYWLDASLFGTPGDLHKNLFDRKIAEQDIRFYTSLGIRNITTFGVRMDGAYLEKHGDRDFLDYAEILSRYE